MHRLSPTRLPHPGPRNGHAGAAWAAPADVIALGPPIGASWPAGQSVLLKLVHRAVRALMPVTVTLLLGRQVNCRSGCGMMRTETGAVSTSSPETMTRKKWSVSAGRRNSAGVIRAVSGSASSYTLSS